MTELLIDVGNSRIKWCVATDEDIGTVYAAAHDGHTLPPQLPAEWVSRALTGVRVSCVGKPALGGALRESLQQRFGERVDWPVTPAAGQGLTNSYPIPHKLGIDRWLALAAAHQMQRGAVCVISIGTAITVDICTHDGQHRGGLIAPGPVALTQALGARTALPSANDIWPQMLELAHDTEDALLCGALHAACGVIERGFHIARDKYSCDVAWLTGGGAEPLAPFLGIPHAVQPHLVLRGLHMRQRTSPWSTHN